MGIGNAWVVAGLRETIAGFPPAPDWGYADVWHMIGTPPTWGGICVETDGDNLVQPTTKKKNDKPHQPQQHLITQERGKRAQTFSLPLGAAV